MKVTVRLIGGFMEKLGFREQAMDLPSGLTAQGLAARLGLKGIPHIVSRNGAGLRDHDELKDGDRVLVSAMFSGG